MFGIRDQAMCELCDMGILVAPQKRCLQQEVMPWLMNKISDFLIEDNATTAGSENVVVDGILDA